MKGPVKDPIDSSRSQTSNTYAPFPLVRMPDFPSADRRIVLEPDCTRCPALVDSRERISWGVGSPDAAVVVVGEAPGAGEPTAERWRGGNWTGMAYTSRHSGRAIRTLFEELGYEPDECYYTNAVKCFPSDGEGSNREPTADELATCRTHLEAEIELIEPQVVVTTGGHATRSVLAAAEHQLDGGFLDAVLKPIEHATFGNGAPDPAPLVPGGLALAARLHAGGIPGGDRLCPERHWCWTANRGIVVSTAARTRFGRIEIGYCWPGNRRGWE